MDIYRMRVFYRKDGLSRFISNKNLQKIIERTLRRLEIPLKFSEGFHPHPKISYAPPLPVNISGSNEFFDVMLTGTADTDTMIARANRILPDGLHFKRAIVEVSGKRHKGGQDITALYTITLSPEASGTGYLEEMGATRTAGSERTLELKTKVNNFSHKPLTGLLNEGAATNVEREILLK